MLKFVKIEEILWLGVVLVDTRYADTTGGSETPQEAVTTVVLSWWGPGRSEAWPGLSLAYET